MEAEARRCGMDACRSASRDAAHRLAGSRHAPGSAGSPSLQGIPAGVEPSLRVVEIFETAADMYTEAAEPRALLADISREAFAEVFRGEGRNAPVTPIESVAARAGALALFVATVGARVTDRIRTCSRTTSPRSRSCSTPLRPRGRSPHRRLADRFDRAEDPASSSGMVSSATARAIAVGT